MKLKYYLRGLGVGILFCALIATIAYNTDKSNNMSDEEVIRRAEKLGMVMADSTEKGETTEEITTEATTEVVKETTEATTEATTEKISETTTEVKETTTEVTETTTQATTESTTEEKKEDATTEKPKDDKKDASYTKATISVTAGMDSSEVARLLQDAGIIKDYLDFDNYLNQNGYSTQIRIKSCEFNSKMSYEEIAKLLVKEE